MTKKQYILLEAEDAHYEHIFVKKDKISHVYPQSGHTTTLTDTGNGLIVATDSGGIELGYSDAAILMHLLNTYNDNHLLCSMKRYELERSK